MTCAQVAETGDVCALVLGLLPAPGSAQPRGIPAPGLRLFHLWLAVQVLFQKKQFLTWKWFSIPAWISCLIKHIFAFDLIETFRRTTAGVGNSRLCGSVPMAW